MRRIWKTHNGAFYQRVLNGVIHPLCSWRDIPWFIFLDIRAVLSVPSTVWKCPVADNLLCPYVPFKKKKKNPAHNRKSLYCMPRRLGLVKYILLVNNYPIKKVALVWISFEQVHLTRGIFAGIKTSWITVVKMCSGFLIKSTIQWPFFFVLFCFHLLQPSKSAEIFPVGDFGGWRRFVGVSVSEDHSVRCWKIEWQRRCLMPPK